VQLRNIPPATSAFGVADRSHTTSRTGAALARTFDQTASCTCSTLK
jgi:hypothetical protein